ncbi:hypothetical protein E3T34_15570 [Cryobacterium sp. TMT1-62]|nr:hypothetical protein E3N86_03825 [Cryobacterium sp. Hz7]TFD29499.1 hypothetical protein E3T34_15570 [Cryobacterium sp. TMT1-62]
MTLAVLLCAAIVVVRRPKSGGSTCRAAGPGSGSGRPGGRGTPARPGRAPFGAGSPRDLLSTIAPSCPPAANSCQGRGRAWKSARAAAGLPVLRSSAAS